MMKFFSASYIANVSWLWRTPTTYKCYPEKDKFDILSIVSEYKAIFHLQNKPKLKTNIQQLPLNGLKSKFFVVFCGY